MTEATHTPGPWVVKGISMDNGNISIGPSEHRFIIAYVTNACSFGDFVQAALKDRTFGEPKDAHTQHANAHLIAAAPDMLEALQQIVAEFGPDLSPSMGTIETGRAVIAKATGATP